MFHGSYDQWTYHPLLVFDSRGFPVAARLRADDAHDSWEAVEVLGRVISRLREASPRAEVLLRADAGFAVPELHEFCEAERVACVIGLGTNSRPVSSFTRRPACSSSGSASTWLAAAA